MSNRKEITKQLTELLKLHINPNGDTRIYTAAEVTFDYYSAHPIRVDYMKFKPVNNSPGGIERGSFYCYEIKSCKEDFESGHGLNFIGDFTELNGLLNSIRASSGKLPYHGHENGGFVYRGLEYFLSVSYTWIDGIIIHDGKYWICDNPDNYSKSIYKFDENGNATEELLYKEITAFQIPNTGFISKMGYDEETGLTLPVETNGGSNTGYCDSFGKPSSSNAMNIVRWRTQTYAQSAQASHSGLFSWSCSSPSTSRTYSSARLSYSHS